MRKAGGRACRTIGLDGGRRMQSLPFLTFAGKYSGRRQVHIVFRCGQFRPQRQDQDSATSHEIKSVDVRAALTEPEMPDRARVVCARIILVCGSEFGSLAREPEELASCEPLERCRTTGIRAFWTKI
jgi:hypothetical protein